MKSFLSFLLLGIMVSCNFAQTDTTTELKTTAMTKTLYDFKATDIDGKEYDMSQLRGKKVMIVNVASYCGYTHQYKDLQALYEKYSDSLVILGFPCNQFMGQEPSGEEAIKEFCEKNYGVSFPLFSKIDVKGKDQDPIYEWLTTKAQNGVEDSEVSWNFNKYLINEKGEYVAHLKSTVEPFDEQIIQWIEGNQ